MSSPASGSPCSGSDGSACTDCSPRSCCFGCFDIVKVGPVGWADRKDGAVGVMADDVVAGLIVAAMLFIATIRVAKSVIP